MEVTLYSRILVHYPSVILIVIFVFSSTCLIVPLMTEKFPDFSDPQLGFEARGTPLAQRLMAWTNLMESSSPRGYLIDNPLEYYYYLQDQKKKEEKEEEEEEEEEELSIKISKTKNKKNHKKHKKHRAKSKNLNDKRINKHKLKNKEHHRHHNSYEEDENEYGKKNFVKIEKQHIDNKSEELFFCNMPNSAYARVVISSNDEKQSLWSLNGILAQCYIDEILRTSSSQFESLCQRHLGHTERCCRSWSPANYIALLSNRTSCLAVTEDDLSKVESILNECYYFYQKLELTPDCGENFKCQRRVPAACYAYDNAVYYLLHYLLDIDFRIADRNNVSDSLLRSVMIILPIAASTATLDYYNELGAVDLKYNDFSVSAMQFGLKNTLFDKLLISDSFYLIFGIIFVITCIWIYTASFLITLATIFAVIFSLGISYAIYVYILRITLFPFMNILGIVVAVGIGSDDAFIFCKIWECSKCQKSFNIRNDLPRLMHETIKDAVPSMFVSTLTTAVAFFASIVSNVTAINCFSIFSGMTVIINFLLMISWLPASIVIAERCCSNFFLTPSNFIVRKLIRPLKLIVKKFTIAFTRILIKTAMLFKYSWFVILLFLGFISCYVVFRYPGLQLPDSPDFQLFDSGQLFERYDLIYAQRYRFEIMEQGDGGEVLPLRFVWGVLPVDNGNYLNPESRGTLVIDESFDIGDRESQVWLQKFCENLRLQTFYRSTFGPLLSNCFIESLRPWMNRPCTDFIDPNIDYSPCCESSAFPYEPKVLKQCAAEAIAEIYRTPVHLWNFGSAQGIPTAGLKFRKHNFNLTDIADNKNGTLVLEKIVSDVVAVIVEYDSNFTYSLSYAEMHNFYTQVENWMQSQLLTAPRGMKNGWFVSYLEFYELQRTLYEGTIWAIVVSMGLALTVLALVTLNPFVSIYAIFAVGAAIVVTVAILVLIGWKLNVLESIAVSTAIGFAVDFSLHYGVSYRASIAEQRRDRAKAALEQMGGPTLMAALTTGAAGALMLPSRVLAYIQIGIFLVVVMSASWIYATFFLCPMLAIAGPSYRFAQFSYPKIKILQRSLFKSERRKVNYPNETEELNSLRKRPDETLVETPLNDSIAMCQIHSSSSRPSSPNTILLT